MQYIQWIIKGLAMGAADVVPGVSGGTLAFILGIYERLLAAISNCNVQALRLLGRGKIAALWQHIDGTFLLCLFGGIFISIFSLAGVISYFLEYRPIPLWALFNGLILAALPTLIKSLHWNLLRVGLCLLGVAFAVSVGMLAPHELKPAAWLFFVAGAEIFMPDSVGAWSAGHGNSFAIGFFASPYPTDQELLGAWLIPVAISSALLVITLTRKVLRVLKNNM